MLTQKRLTELYKKQRKSMQDIAHFMGCSLHKVAYWMDRYKIPRRSISDASYLKHNPNGDPFRFRPPRTLSEQLLFGLGLGLYWGEGTKASMGSVRLGNTDPLLLEKFMKFLITFFGVRKSDLRFGLQIFTDIDECEALDYWTKMLRVNPKQFGTVVVTKSGSLGTYRKKSQYGVVTVYYNTTKLR